MKATTLTRIARHVPSPLLHVATRRRTRGVVLSQIFRRMPEMLTPTGRKARGAIRFDIGDGQNVDTWYAVLANGICETSRELDSARPRVTISISAYDFVRLVTGADPIKLFTAGKLRLAGDTYFGASVAELFDIPK